MHQYNIYLICFIAKLASLCGTHIVCFVFPCWIFLLTLICFVSKLAVLSRLVTDT